MAEPRPVGRGVDQLVLRLRRADAVIIEALAKVGRAEGLARLGRGEARIEKAFAAAVPGGLGKFHPLHRVVQRPAAVDVDQAQRAPVAARILHGIGEIFAVGRGRPFGQRARPVARPAIGVEQQPLRSRQAFADIERGLVFQTLVIAIEIAAARLARHGVAAMGEERLQPGLERIAPRQRVEIAAGERIFLRHPVAHRRIAAQVVFEPAIGVGHLDAEMILHQVQPPRGGIAQGVAARGDRRFLRQGAGDRRCGGQPERQQDQGGEAHPLFDALFVANGTGRVSLGKRGLPVKRPVPRRRTGDDQAASNSSASAPWTGPES